MRDFHGCMPLEVAKQILEEQGADNLGDPIDVNGFNSRLLDREAEFKMLLSNVTDPEMILTQFPEAKKIFRLD